MAYSGIDDINVEEYQDEACSYTEDVEDSCEDRSDATYDIEYPCEAIHDTTSELQRVEEEPKDLSEQLAHVSSCGSFSNPEDVDPDSLNPNSPVPTYSDDDQDDPKTVVDRERQTSQSQNSEDLESECSYRDKENQFDAEIVCQSRDSVDSHRSISFFVDLEDDLNMSQSMIQTPTQPHRRPPRPYRTQSHGDRMTQSMFADTSRPSSGVSFFVDLSNDGDLKSSSRDKTQAQVAPRPRPRSFLKTVSREEPDRDLEEVSEDMHVKSKLLMEKSLMRTQNFFDQLKNYIDYLGKPSYSKEELKKKKTIAANITRLMFEEEENLRNGRHLSDTKFLEQIIQQGIVKPDKTKNVAIVETPSPVSSQSESGEKPTLRRERTFDMDPKMSIRQISIDDTSGPHVDDTKRTKSNQLEVTTNLEKFQQQRKIHTEKLKTELSKIEKIEQQISNCERKKFEKKSNDNNVADHVRPPKPQKRECWTDKRSIDTRKTESPTERVTSFRNLSPRTSSASSKASSSYSWFIPNDGEDPAEREEELLHNVRGRHERSRGIQTGDSLLRSFRERHDKAVFVRDRPQAYFITCDEKSESEQKPVPKPRTVGIIRSQRVKEETPVIKTTVIDLETETLPEENNLQEALRRNRPDYIARTKDRERDRMARSFAAEQRRSAASATLEAMSRSTSALSCSSVGKKSNNNPAKSPYAAKSSKSSQQLKVPAKEVAPSRPSSSTSVKSRIPRTSSANKNQNPTAKKSNFDSGKLVSVYGFGKPDHQPQLRSPSTATLHSNTKSKASSRAELTTSRAVRRTENARLSDKSRIFKEQIRDGSKLLVR